MSDYQMFEVQVSRAEPLTGTGETFHAEWQTDGKTITPG